MRIGAGILAAALLLAGCGGAARGGLTQTSVSARPSNGLVDKIPSETPARRAAKRSVRVRDADPQPSWRPFTGPVPILVYHELGAAPADEPWPGLYVSDADFRSEMAWMHARGYTAVTLDEVMAAWYHHGRLPRKPVVITFDNGYPPQVTFAPRVMARYGWPGVLNEITEDHLGPAAIRHVLRLGWEVDSHSLTHPDLTELSGAALTAQVRGSRRFLRHAFAIASNSFCYPSSEYDAAVIAAVKAAGYENATTENAGYAVRAHPYLLNRFEIEGGVSELAADLAQTH